jgi:molybdate transport system regulatory protein
MRRNVTVEMMAKLFVRIDFEGVGAVGPGKARMLELIDECGSIRRAAVVMKMSYAHAWKLLGATEDIFGEPLVTTVIGGLNGGGVKLTEFGRAVIAHYRDIERSALAAAAGDLEALAKNSSPHQTHFVDLPSNERRIDGRRLDRAIREVRKRRSS